jgi:hypothetical protein
VGLPFLFNLRSGHLSPDVVGPRAWNFIAIELASIRKVSLLTNCFGLFLFLGPFHTDVIMVGGRWIKFFLPLIDKIEVGFLGCALALKGGLLKPNWLRIGRICMKGEVLAGPGEQLSLMD